MKPASFLVPIFLLLISNQDRISAQIAGIEWLTTRQGLSQGYVSCLLQDREGFIWAGTKNGLNRYDGYRFEVFTYDPYDEFSLSGDFIGKLAEYGDFIIVVQEWGSIDLLHKKTRRVYRLQGAVPGLNTPLERCQFLWAAADAAGNIWAQLHAPWPHLRIFRISIPPEFWKNPPADNAWQKRITLQTWPRDVALIPHMCADGKSILVPGPEGIFEIDTESGRWTVVGPPLSPEKHDDGTMIQYDEHGGFWIARRFVAGHRHATDFHAYHRVSPGQPAGALQPLALDLEHLSLQHISHGFAWLNLRGDIKGYRVDQRGGFDLSRPEITGLQLPDGLCSSMTDRSGIVWFGTNGLGIVKVNPQSKRFRNLLPGESIYCPIVQSRDGQIVTFSNTNKLLYHPPGAAQGLAAHFRHLTAFSMMLDSGDTCWIAGRIVPGDRWVLKKIPPAGTPEVFSLPYAGRSRPALNIDPAGDVWIATDQSLIRFNRKTRAYSRFDLQEALSGSSEAYSLAWTADGSWWLATGRGLVRVKPAGGPSERVEFERLKNERSTRNSLSNDMVASLLTDPNDPYVLWIGTKGGGLDRLDVRTLRFTHLGRHEGLPDNVIYGVLAEAGPYSAGGGGPSADGGGPSAVGGGPSAVGTSLWMSSNKGLVHYTPSTGAIKNYTEEDGVQANEFNTAAYGKGPNGELLFGGVNGLTMFHPNELQGDTVGPHTLITGLRINDRDVSWKDSTGILTQGIEFTTEITVPFSRNSLTLEFAALSYASPAKNRFRYYLQGAEPDWAHESANRTASYLNLAPGTYVFRVKGSNSEGVWSERPTELKITVLAPWYRTWLAWTAYGLILGGSIFGFYRYQLRTRLEHAENRRLKELDAFKSRFFTNITHEFRTPLTVILGMTEQLRSNSANGSSGPGASPRPNAVATAAALIRRNGQNLLNLINQMLDLARLEAGQLRLNTHRGDVVPYLHYLTESFQSYADTKGIALSFRTELPAFDMTFDKEKLQTVVTNLLSNAIKFTPAGGEVIVRVDRDAGLEARKGESVLTIRVADTGRGISPEQLPRIFDRFYQADPAATHSSEGTGIGLALVRELVKIMRGDIRVESVTDRGTTFTVRLPSLPETEPGGAIPAAGNAALPAPFYPDGDAAAPEAAAGTENPDAPLVLVVEDNPDVRHYLAACLQADYRIAMAENGQDGIEAAFKLAPDLVVSDVMMPIRDGFELCETLKNDARTSHVPLVLLTAKADVASRIEGLTRGADDYLAKPFDRRELLVRLRNLIESRRRLQARYASMDVPAATDDPDVQIEDAFLQTLRSFLESRLDDAELSLETMCRVMGMGRTNLNRKLNALTGRSAVQYLRALRMHRARQLLAEGRLNISEIAFEVGYDDPKYFSRVFTEECGVPPTQWR